MKKVIYVCLAAMVLGACQESLEKRAERECKEYTKKYCPVPISDNTTVDSMVFEKVSHTIHYFYTLKGIADTTALPLETARVEMLDALRNSTTEKPYKDAGYNFAYTYYSTKHPGQKIVDVIFTPEDYQAGHSK